MRLLKKIVWIIVFIPVICVADVRLPKLIGDGMVLQRNARVRIWGWASAAEKITVHFLDGVYQTRADSNGDWSVIFPELKAGGPFSMRIDGANSITINDILIGDVWVCSGQSNMGLTMGAIADAYPDDIAAADNPFIRQFFIAPGTSFNGPEKDFRFDNNRFAGSGSVKRCRFESLSLATRKSGESHALCNSGPGSNHAICTIFAGYRRNKRLRCFDTEPIQIAVRGAFLLWHADCSLDLYLGVCLRQLKAVLGR